MNSPGGAVPTALMAALLGAWAFGAAAPAPSSGTVCRHPGADGGEARRVDLGRVGQGQASLRGAFRGRLRMPENPPGASPKESPEASLSRGVLGCARPERRQILLREALPPPLRGRRLVFLPPLGAGAEPSPAFWPLGPNDAVFVLGPLHPEGMAALGRKLSRPVTAASPALAQLLGIRCAPSRVESSQDGLSLAIDEVRP